MNRYIGVDKLIDDIRPFAEYDSNRSNKDWVRRFEIAINAQPTADVVEVVRCKDCRWKQGSECVRFADVRPFPDDFCSRAERRTDDQIH